MNMFQSKNQFEIKNHVTSLKKLEEKVENQEFKIEKAIYGSRNVLNRLRWLEGEFTQKFKDRAEAIVEVYFVNDLTKIGQLISGNDFDEAEKIIKDIEKRIKDPTYIQDPNPR